jgi:hypothetical protein
MTMILHRPIRDVRELFQFLAHWRDVPAAVPPVVLPAGTPTPLRDLYQRFGSLAAREWWVGPNLCWSVGLFSGQNFLVAPTRLGKDSFAAAGERHWLIVRENQECWFVWVPAGKDEDPLIAYTAAHEEPSASALEMTKIPLSQFLATHVLVETSFASPRLWCIGDRPFRVGEFQLPLVPLMMGSTMGYPPLQYDFLVDPTERVLVMNMPESDFTWVATRDLDIEEIFFDPAICDDCRSGM